MSRLTLGNAVKVWLVVVFFPLLAFLVLLIGGVKKRLAVVLEGLVYAAGFVVSLAMLDVIGLGGLLALAAMGVSGVRSWHLRDLWLPTKRRRWWHRFTQGESRELVADSPPPEAALGGAEGRAAALGWIGSLGEQNRLRLPANAYGDFQETFQKLGAVLEAEQREPFRDARFEYELDAMVREYLPAVLGNYLAIPEAMADDRQPNGRTPKEEVAEQLQLLAGQAEALQVSRHSRVPDQLTTTGNFLREKYGQRAVADVDFRVQ